MRSASVLYKLERADEAAAGRAVTVRAERRPLHAPEIAELLAVTRKLCDALVYIHGEGVVHRDFTPENVIIDDDGRARPEPPARGDRRRRPAWADAGCLPSCSPSWHSDSARPARTGSARRR